MEEFGRRYHTLKAPRRVNWHPSLGVVELELEVAGTAIDFKVGAGRAAGQWLGSDASWTGGASWCQHWAAGRWGSGCGSV